MATKRACGIEQRSQQQRETHSIAHHPIHSLFLFLCLVLCVCERALTVVNGCWRAAGHQRKSVLVLLGNRSARTRATDKQQRERSGSNTFFVRSLFFSGHSRQAVKQQLVSLASHLSVCRRSSRRAIRLKTTNSTTTTSFAFSVWSPALSLSLSTTKKTARQLARLSIVCCVYAHRSD